MQGKFIVLESIDGGGTETQSKRLVEHLKKLGKDSVYIYYPDYGPDKHNPTKPIGLFLKNFQRGQYKLDPEIQFIFYSSDMIKDKPLIIKALKDGKIIVADRYFSSTLAYQGLRGFSIEKALKFAELFDLVKPDLIIFLDVSPETAHRWKMEEEKEIDINEKDVKLGRDVRQEYKNLAKNNVFSKWEIVNGEQAKDNVEKEVRKTINEKLKMGI